MSEYSRRRYAEKAAADYRAYYVANREKKLEYSRRYRAANRQKMAEKDRRFYVAKREARLEWQRRYHLENRRNTIADSSSAQGA